MGDGERAQPFGDNRRCLRPHATHWNTRAPKPCTASVFTERDLVAHVAGLYPDGATSQELMEATREGSVTEVGLPAAS